MADFTDDQILTAASQLGAPPDFVRQQLLAEGHNVISGQPAMTLPQAAPMAAGSAPVAAPPLAQQSAPGDQWMVNAGNLQMPPPPAAPSPSAGPAAQPRRAGVRATGQAGLASAQPGASSGATGSPSRVRQLFDAKQRQLEQQTQGAYEQVAQGQQKLDELGATAFGFEQDRLNKDADFAQRRAAQFDEYERLNQQAMQADAVAREKEDNVVRAKQEQLDKERDEYANARVREMPASSRVASAFAMAFSGIADALNAGVGNQSQFMASTMQIVNDNIDRDVQEQLRQIEAKKGATDDHERSLLRLRAQTQDDRAFRAATRSAYYDQFSSRLERLGAESASETARITAQSALPVFQQASEAAKQEARGANLADVQKRLRQVEDARFGVEVGMAMPKAGPKDKEDKQTPGVVGLVQIAPEATTSDRTKAQEITSGAAGITQNIALLKQMAKKGATLSPDERAIARRRLGALKSQFNGVFGDGTAPNEAQLEALDDMFANPTEMNVGNAYRQFEVFEQDAKAQTDSKLRSYGYQLGGDADFQGE